jgi:uncharacterized membrane protein YeaQ/YmgE (transglycosylase-associated protein family)
MNSRSLVWLGTIVGSTLGGLIPELWGASFLSFSSLFFSALGACIGIYIGFTLSQ